jgi:hypothetical protein
VAYTSDKVKPASNLTRVCNGTEAYAMVVLQNVSPSAETPAVSLTKI